MRNFIEATKAAVAAGNWYAALTIALTMPDICGRLEDPSKGSQARFVGWYDRYLLKCYQFEVGSSQMLHTFLCGSDCYALRCAFLHQGEFGIDDQSARQALEHFHFTAPRPGSFIHMNQYDMALQLQVDRFCLDVCDGVEQWLQDIQGNADIQARMGKLATIS